MNDNHHQTTLRFDGSLWCNLDVALRALDQVYGIVIEPFGLTVIEWCILRTLYLQDGMHASELARSVGRAATSFTPLLDKLQAKNYLERRPDHSDRRAVCIYLTPKALNLRGKIMRSADEIEARLRAAIPAHEWETFHRVLAQIQGMQRV